jgi:hypothetical protein
MAEVSKQDVDLLKNYMSETNQGIKTLIELRKQEDTPRSLLAGNAFEIGAQVTLAKKREGFDTKEGMIEVDNRVVDNTAVLNLMLEPIKQLAMVMKESFETQKEIRDLTITSNKLADKATEEIKKEGTLFVNQIGQVSENIDGIVRPLNRMEKLTKGMPGKNPLFGKTGSESNIAKSAEEEKRKDQKSFYADQVDTLANTITKPFSNLAKSFSGFAESTTGQALIVSGVLFLVLNAISTFPDLARAIGDTIKIIGNFFGDYKKLVTGELSFLQFFENQLGVAMVTSLALFSSRVRKFFLSIGTKLLGVGKMLLRVFAIPVLVISAILGFFEGYNESRASGKGIMESIGVGLARAIESVFNLIIDTILGTLEFIGTAVLGKQMVDDIKGYFTDLGKSLFSFLSFGDASPKGKYMGGPVAAGTPYVVGEMGPELFVPGASGSIVPNGMGGGQPIIVNNTNVNAPTSNNSHQHANVSITDRQQEITGL